MVGPLPEGEPDSRVTEATERGALKFVLDGRRLEGRYVLNQFDRDGRNRFSFRTE